MIKIYNYNLSVTNNRTDTNMTLSETRYIETSLPYIINLANLPLAVGVTWFFNSRYNSDGISVKKASNGLTTSTQYGQY